MSTSLFDHHPWESGYERFKTVVLPKLREHGKRIGAASATNDDAKKIIQYYKMLERSFDVATAIFLEDRLDKWLKENPTL